MNRNLLRMLIASLLAVALAIGCGRKSEPTGPGPLPSPGPDTLSFVAQGRLMGDEGIIDVGVYGVPEFVDIDGDRDLDLFVGEWWGKIWFYRNTGTAAAAEFVLESTAYKGIHVGRAAAPAFVDIDGDDDFDLFIGSMYTVGFGDGGLWFYRNVGSETKDSFELVSQNILGIPTTGISKPAFGDLDGDHKFDLLFGYEEAYPDGHQGLVYARNTGTQDDPGFTVVTDSLLPFASSYGTCQYLFPCLHDFDRDGDLDLMTGYMRQLLYYKNEGTAAEPDWVHMQLPDGLVVVPNVGLVPNVVDLNNDGLIDLAVGTGSAFANFPDDVEGVVYLFNGQ